MSAMAGVVLTEEISPCHLLTRLLGWRPHHLLNLGLPLPHPRAGSVHFVVHTTYHIDRGALCVQVVVQMTTNLHQITGQLKRKRNGYKMMKEEYWD